MRKLAQQFVGCLPLPPLQEPTDRDLRRDRDEQRHVIPPHMPLHDRDFRLPADLADDIPYAQGDFPGERGPAILGHPHKMEVNLKNRVRPVSILFHAPILRERGALAKAVA